MAADLLTRQSMSTWHRINVEKGELAFVMSFSKEDEQDLKPQLAMTMSYFIYFTTDHFGMGTQKTMQRNQKKYNLWEENLFRRVRGELTIFSTEKSWLQNIRFNQ